MSTREKLMLGLAAVAGVALILCVVAVILIVLFRPELSTDGLGEVISTQLSVIFGAVLGYAARGPIERQKTNGSEQPER